MIQISLYIFAACIFAFISLDIFLLFWIRKSENCWADAFAIWGKRNEGGKHSLSIEQQKLLRAVNALKPISIIGTLTTATLLVLFVS